MYTVYKEFAINYGKEMMKISVPAENLLGELVPRPRPAVLDIKDKIREILSNPVGTPPLRDFISGEKLTIVLPDQTRVLPTAQLLPLLINELEAIGITRDQMTLVIGAGNHRPPVEEEKKAMLGELYGHIRCFHSKELGYKLMGITSRGTPVEVAAPVAEADFVMALGNVELHQLAGFSGGVKAVAAGTASRRALEANHKLGRLDQDVGREDAKPHVRLDMEEFAQIAGLKFIINTVMNQTREVIYLAGGHPVAAHQACARVAEVVYRLPITRQADIVIASPGGDPRDATLYQAQKGLQNALRAVKEKGVIIMAAECGEGLGDPHFKQRIMEGDTRECLVEKRGDSFVLGAHKAAYIVKVLQRARVLFVSDISAEVMEKIHFTPCSGLQGALREAFSLSGANPEILMMPWAGLTVPELTFKNDIL